jgi:hypothetical protein
MHKDGRLIKFIPDHHVDMLRFHNLDKYIIQFPTYYLEDPSFSEIRFCSRFGMVDCKIKELQYIYTTARYNASNHSVEVTARDINNTALDLSTILKRSQYIYLQDFLYSNFSIIEAEKIEHAKFLVLHLDIPNDGEE